MKENQQVIQNYSNNEFLLVFVEEWTKIVEIFNYKQNIDGKNKKKYKPFESPIQKKLVELSLITGISESDLKSKQKLATKHRDQLIKNNEKLVQSILNKFIEKYNCANMENALYNAGLIGLTHCIEAYRSEYKIKFSSFAYQPIWRAIRINYYQENTSIYIPENTQKNSDKRKKFKEQEKIQVMQAKNMISLSQTIPNTNLKFDEVQINSIFADYGQQSNCSEPEELLKQIEQAEIIDYLLSCLKPMELELIQSIYGLNQQPLTVIEYAKQKKITRQCAHNYLRNALKKMRSHAQNNKIELENYL